MASFPSFPRSFPRILASPELGGANVPASQPADKLLRGSGAATKPVFKTNMSHLEAGWKVFIGSWWLRWDARKWSIKSISIFYKKASTFSKIRWWVMYKDCRGAFSFFLSFSCQHLCQTCALHDVQLRCIAMLGQFGETLGQDFLDAPAYQGLGSVSQWFIVSAFKSILKISFSKTF